uniref:Uncharacterized protein n=1 Tax=Romanomermis culicivorax TaxID=13658 RepID=A0A915I5I5_ROMCU
YASLRGALSIVWSTPFGPVASVSSIPSVKILGSRVASTHLSETRFALIPIARYDISREAGSSIGAGVWPIAVAEYDMSREAGSSIKAGIRPIAIAEYDISWEAGSSIRAGVWPIAAANYDISREAGFTIPAHIRLIIVLTPITDCDIPRKAGSWIWSIVPRTRLFAIFIAITDCDIAWLMIIRSIIAGTWRFVPIGTTTYFVGVLPFDIAAENFFCEYCSTCNRNKCNSSTLTYLGIVAGIIHKLVRK